MDAGTMKGVWTSRNFTTVLLIDYILFLDLEEILFMTCRERTADGGRSLVQDRKVYFGSLSPFTFSCYQIRLRRVPLTFIR